MEIETKISDISVKSRLPYIVDARVMYYYLAKKYTVHSYQKIASRIGFHHATAIHSMKSYDNWKFASLQYHEQLTKLHDMEKLIPEIQNSEVGPSDLHELFRARNVALNSEVNKLIKILKERDEQIEDYKRRLTI